MYCSPRAFISRVLCAALFAGGAGLPLTTQAAGSITIQKLAPYDPDLSVPAAVKLECELAKKIPAYTEANAKGNFERIIVADKVSAATPGQSLAMTIVGLGGAAGGVHTGTKHIIIEGTLWENGKVKGTFRAKRKTGVSWGPGYTGTCKLLDRCAKSLGKDVAKWLENPGKDSKLGDTL